MYFAYIAHPVSRKARAQARANQRSALGIDALILKNKQDSNVLDEIKTNDEEVEDGDEVDEGDEDEGEQDASGVDSDDDDNDGRSF